MKTREEMRKEYSKEYQAAYNYCIRKHNANGGGVGRYEEEALDQVRPRGVDPQEFAAGYSSYINWLMFD